MNSSKKLRKKWASLVAQMVKRLPAMRENWIRSLGPEDPLKEEIATHSSTLAWKIPCMEEPGRLQSMGFAKSQTRVSDFTNTKLDQKKRQEQISPLFDNAS